MKWGKLSRVLWWSRRCDYFSFSTLPKQSSLPTPTNQSWIPPHLFPFLFVFNSSRFLTISLFYSFCFVFLLFSNQLSGSRKFKIRINSKSSSRTLTLILHPFISSLLSVFALQQFHPWIPSRSFHDNIMILALRINCMGLENFGAS